MSKFYVLEKIAAHKQGRRSEYTRLIDRVYAPDEATALNEARDKHGAAKPLTVQRANPGYDEGR